MSRVLGAALLGVDGVAVEVEVLLSSQLPRVDIVGLPEASVRESAARVRAAISALGLPFPTRRVTVNLAPAALPKSGAGLDLPIAVGILAAAELLEEGVPEGTGLLGELALDGRLRPVRGALALCLALRDAGCRSVVVPRANGAEAALAPGLTAHAADDLARVLEHLRGRQLLPPARASAPPAASRGLDAADVRGQERAKRALEIAAAGGHAALLRGPPGSGKTMLARRLPGFLPPLDVEEALEVTRIHGAAGGLSGPVPVACERPFRAPHHTASPAGVLGGGNPPRPGEVSLAHCGVLFLDELPEFDRRTLESLRQVLEERRVVVARARLCCVFPAHFQLVAASNPCPCGWYGSGLRDCRCDDAAIARYRARISGPLLDRIDLLVPVPAVAWRDLDTSGTGASSRELRQRVVRARRAQERRGRSLGVRTNAELPDAALDAATAATAEARALLGRAVDGLGLTARGARRVLRVARSIADLEDEARVSPAAMAEALTYRRDVAPGGESLCEPQRRRE